MRTAKSLLTLLLFVTALTTLTACGENSKGSPTPVDSRPSDVVTREIVAEDAITGERESRPTAAACLRTLPRDSNWTHHRRSGFRRYNIGSYSWNVRTGHGTLRWPSIYVQTLTNDGFCGCGPGYQPVCDPYNGGMACMRLANYALVTWGWDGSGFSTTNIRNSRRGNHLAPPPMSNGCYAHVAQSCFVGFDETCAVGICEPVSGNSPIGVCVRGRR